VAFQQVLHTLYFPVTLPPWGMEVMFLARKDCGKINGQSSLSSDVTGFNLSNGLLSLSFDLNNHLATWSTISSTNNGMIHSKTQSLYQAYFRYDESVTPRKSSATYGANMYSFYPNSTSKEPITLTPSVKFIHSNYLSSSLTLSRPSISICMSVSLSLSLSPSLSNTCIQMHSHLCSPSVSLSLSLAFCLVYSDINNCRWSTCLGGETKNQ
jgi:hypothetical protein